MKIIIAGAGDVGLYLCQILSEDGHAVTLIEEQEKVADDVESNLDVRVIRGNGASAKCLEIAGVQDCEYFMAMTSHDQLNIVACAVASKLGARNTIARVYDQIYADNSKVSYEEYFNIDTLINPEALTAVELAKHVRNPERMAVEDFARGQIELQEIRVSATSKLLEKPLKDITLPQSLRIGYIDRDEKLVVPTANTVLKAGDKITVIGTPEVLLSNRKLFTNEDSSAVVRIVLNGATETSIALIKRLTHYRFKIRVIESDFKKCRDLAERFPNVTVIHGSATSLRLLEEEQVGDADYFISCTKDDEENVMTCLQAKKLGAKHIELVINKPDYEQVLQNISGFLDIRAAVSPRKVTTTEIKKYISNKDFIAFGELKGGAIEFLELKVPKDCHYIGKTLREIPLPPACIIAAMVNENSAKVPNANDIISPSDRLVIILEKERRTEVVKIFLP